jgi:alpha-tubulin suppressor-like RCC1 family protein
MRSAACAAAILAAVLGCSNPLANIVKDVALQNTASLASLSITSGTTDLRLSPGFSTSILAYRALATRSVTQVTVKAVAADADAKVTVNGQTQSITGVSVPLVQDTVNDVIIVVSSASGLEQKTYSIGVSRGIIRQLTGGGSFNLAVNGDGTLWTWGSGNSALGDGTYTGRSLPAWVSGIAEVRSASTTYYNVLALKEDSTVWSWGGNWAGQLGDGTTGDREVPGQVVGAGGAGNLSDIKAVAAGWDHSLALKSDGTVWAWGSNSAGALGDTTTTNRPFPVRVQGGLTTVDAIAAGNGFSLALKHDGTVWAWGANWKGQLGDGTLIDKHTPVPVSGLTGAKAIAAGANFSLALMADGTVKSWGGNGEGQLGNPAATDPSPTPVSVSILTGIKTIAAAWTHSVALMSDGNVYTWGSNWKGEQGDGTIVSRSTPHLVPSLPPAMAIGIGAQSVLVLTQDDKVYWWGSGYYQPSSIFTTPVQVQGMTPSLGASVSAGAGHSAAVSTDNKIWTWGDNYVGQLGYATTVDIATATQVPSLPTLNAAVAAGALHTLALRSDNTVRVWGYGPDGQLGDGLGINSATPVTVTDLTGITTIAAGYYHSLARKSDGTVWAWGRNSNGQLGNNGTSNQWVAVQVTGLAGASAVAGGESHSLALKSDGSVVWAWGYNGNGQLGDGTNTERHSNVAVTGLTGTVTAIACGAQHSLALKSDGTVWAWGGGWLGQLGNGTTMNVNVPVQVTGLAGITAIAAGNSHNLALDSNKDVWAWGTNQFGQLGNGSLLSSNVPVKVSGLTGITAIGAGAAFSLAVKSDGTVWAWGSGESGQLGNGTIAFKFAPVLLEWP